MQTINSAIAEALKCREITPMSKTSSDGWKPTLDAYCPILATARDAAGRFIADMAAGAKPYWLALLGHPGTGKTFIAKQVYEQAKQFNPGNPSLWLGPGPRPCSIWIDATKFGQQMMDGRYDLPESLAPDWIVAIDDLGAQRDKTDFIADGMYRLCNARLGKWTLWTANLSLAEISARVDARVASRLVRDENKVITLNCADYALRA